MANDTRHCRLTMARCGARSLSCGQRKFLRPLLFLLLLFPASKATTWKPKDLDHNLESFFCSVDEDGDGEIEQGEATKFLESLDARLDKSEEDKSGPIERMTDSSMSRPFDFNFSYGGNAISTEELLNHLQNMMTADHVVEWITHGLQLPQYAETFRWTAITGLDFPALIEHESRALAEELGVKSLLHRTKITHAIVRQIFGIGATPGPPQGLLCENSSSGGIQLHWAPPSSRGYPPVHKYLLQRWSVTTLTWVQIADTSEDFFLDTDLVSLGRPLSYRAQAWGGHGPSDWLVLGGCIALLHPGSTQCVSNANMPSLEHAYPVPHQGEPSYVSLSDLHRKKNVWSSAGDSWGWISSFNGGLLLLAIFSRNSFCSRVTVAAWVILKVKVVSRLWLIVVDGQESRYLCLRTLARFCVLVLMSWNYIHTHILILSSLAQPKEGVGRSGLSSTEKSARCFTRADSLEAICTDRIVRQAASFNSNLDNAILSLPSFESKLQTVSPVTELREGHARSVSEGSNHSNSSALYFGENSITRSFKLSGPSGVHSTSVHSFNQVDSQRVSASSNPSGHTHSNNDLKTKWDVDFKVNGVKPQQRRKYRCNHREGCKVRFDRWHYWSDWRMSFSKHFCRECQSVFCVKHTRISPHGPSGQCGLDSSCVCYSCFNTLPPETQHKLQSINKLRFGPSSNSLSRKMKMTGTSLLCGAGLPLSHSKYKGLDSTSVDSDSFHLGGELVGAATSSSTDLSLLDAKT